MMHLADTTSTTLRRLQEDDLARQAVLRYQRDPDSIIYPNSRQARTVHALCERVFQQDRLPQTVGEWLAVVMLHRNTSHVTRMRLLAEEDGQASYVQSHTWLGLIDETPPPNED